MIDANVTCGTKPSEHADQDNEKAGDEPWHQLLPIGPAFVGVDAGRVRAQIARQERKPEHHRTEHQDAHQLDDGANLDLYDAYMGNVLPNTCGTASTVSPASTPYCVSDSWRTGTSSGSVSTTTTPSTAVNEIDAAMSSLLAPDHRRHRSDR